MAAGSQKPRRLQISSKHYPEPFLAIGLHYRTFDEVTDNAVESMLTACRNERRAAARGSSQSA